MAGEGADLRITISSKNLAQKDIDSIKASLGGLDKAVKDAGNNADKSQKQWHGLSGAMDGISKLDPAKLLAFGAAGLTVGAATGAIGGAITAASNLNETLNKADVVFGGASAAVRAFGETTAQSMGQSKEQAIAAASTFGNLFVGMGLGKQSAADMSMQMVKLASDMASFNNIPVADALEKIRAGLIGESEPLRSVGVLLTEAAVASKAVEMGLASTTTQLSESAKVQARYALILDQTKTAQGDFERTSTGLANSQRIIDASMKDLQATIGNQLLPVITPLVSNFAKALPEAIAGAQTKVDEIRKAADIVGSSFRAWGSYASGVTDALGKIPSPGQVRITEYIPVLGPLIQSWRELNAEIDRWTQRPSNAPEQAAAVKAELDAIDKGMAAELEADKKVAQAKQDQIDADVKARAAADAKYKKSMADVQAMIDAGTSRAVDDHQEKLERMDREAAANAAALAAAKKQQTEWTAEAKKTADKIKAITSDVSDVARKMESEVGAALIRETELWQESGDRWIAKWGEINDAIQKTYSDRDRALADIDEREALNANIAGRRKEVADRISGERKIFDLQMDDTEFHHREELAKEKALRDYQEVLNSGASQEQKNNAWEIYQQRLADLQQEHMDFDAEVQWRLAQEQKRADQDRIWAEQQATLERTLHEEELTRQRDAISQRQQDEEARINAEWTAWETAETAKTTKAAAEATARATANLAAWRDDFINKLEAESAPGIERFIGMVAGKWADAMAQMGAAAAESVGGSGDSVGGSGDSVGGESVDPRHQPGGDIFEEWKLGNPEEYAAWAQEHGVPGFARGGIVPGPVGMPMLALVHGGESITPSGAAIDYDRLAAALARQPIVIRMDSREVGRIVRGALLRDAAALGSLGLGLA